MISLKQIIVLLTFVCSSAFAQVNALDLKEEFRAAGAPDAELLKMIAQDVNEKSDQKSVEKPVENSVDKTVELADEKNVELTSAKADGQAHENIEVSAPLKSTTDSKKLAESDIPVLTSVKEKKVAGGSSSFRVLISFFVLAILAGGLVLFSKWYTKKHTKSTENHKIRVLTQHYLGPKKSLAIVRVAGESILIGVTDHSISMLKSLSLIDDEVPENLPNHFQESMDEADLNPDLQVKMKKESNPTNGKPKADEVDDFVLNTIKDKVSVKLKNMRSI